MRLYNSSIPSVGASACILVLSSKSVVESSYLGHIEILENARILGPSSGIRVPSFQFHETT